MKKRQLVHSVILCGMQQHIVYGKTIKLNINILVCIVKEYSAFLEAYTQQWQMDLNLSWPSGNVRSDDPSLAVSEIALSVISLGEDSN